MNKVNIQTRKLQVLNKTFISGQHDYRLNMGKISLPIYHEKPA